MRPKCTKDFVAAVMAKAAKKVQQPGNLSWKNNGWLQN